MEFEYTLFYKLACCFAAALPVIGAFYFTMRKHQREMLHTHSGSSEPTGRNMVPSIVAEGEAGRRQMQEELYRQFTSYMARNDS